MHVLLRQIAVCVVLMVSVSLVQAQEQQGQKQEQQKQQEQQQGQAQEQQQMHANGLVTGTLQAKDGTPLSGGLVYFFTSHGPIPDPEMYWRVPDFLSEIGQQGVFTLELPEGEYYIGAIKRAAGRTVNGPPEVKDLFYKGVDKDGKPQLFSVMKGEKKDLGTIAEAVPFAGLAKKGTVTGIQGKIVTARNKPVKGALVFAFLSPSIIGKPAFASYRTGRDGAYVLRVNEGGKYYLRVRDIYGGGPPVAGAFIGNYGGETPEAVVVETGKITKKINIHVEKFRGRGEQAPVQ